MNRIPVPETDTENSDRGSKKQRPPTWAVAAVAKNRLPNGLLPGWSRYGLKALTSFPFLPFQIRTMPSSPPATTNDSSRLEAAAYMKSVPPLKLR